MRCAKLHKMNQKFHLTSFHFIMENCVIKVKTTLVNKKKKKNSDKNKKKKKVKIRSTVLQLTIRCLISFVIFDAVKKLFTAENIFPSNVTVS